MTKEEIVENLCKSYGLEDVDNYSAQLLMDTIARETVRINDYEDYLKERFLHNKQEVHKISTSVEKALQDLKKQRNENLKLLYTFFTGKQMDMMGKQKAGYRNKMVKSRKLEALQEIEKNIDNEQIQPQGQLP